MIILANSERIFNPNEYGTEQYQQLNHRYQQQMDEQFSRRQIGYPIKGLSFDVQTIKLTSTMTQQAYKMLQNLIEAFPTSQKSGPIPVVGTEKYRGVIFYDQLHLIDSTEYIVRSPLGFGYAVRKFLTVSAAPQLGSTSGEIKVTIEISPNRLLNIKEEPLIDFLIKQLLPLLTSPRLEQVSFKLDMPIISANFHAQLLDEAGAIQKVTNTLNADLEYETTSLYFADRARSRELIITNEFQNLLTTQLLNGDSGSISSREAQWYQDHADQRQFLTRIALRVNQPAAIKRFMRKHDWLMRDIVIDYRDSSGQQRFEGTAYATHGKDFRRSFTRMITYRLKAAQQTLKKLPYLTDEVWQNTLN